MTSFVSNVTFDCADPYALAQFWSQVTGEPILEECEAGDEEVEIQLPAGLCFEFIRVPEPKVVKNRLHVCLRPDESGREAEVERLLGLGARLVGDLRNEDGTGWAVLADPEGNEFCVLRRLEA